jgi:16S rRNA (cytosine967-C5)-methyltransferase
MHDRVQDIAGSVITKSDREHQADAVLRTELKRQRDLPPELSRETARAVFAYYRWFGWLDGDQPIRQQLQQADRLSERFRREPASFSDAELLAKALPSWVGAQVPLSADWIRALQTEPRIWLRARPGQGRVLSAKLRECSPAGEGLLSDALSYEGSSDLFRTAEFQAGEFELQDISSQAVGWICDPQPHEKWWDACAGEGGKTLHLADLMQNKGLLWASDRAEWRLERLRLRAARAKLFNYRAVLWNGGAKLPTKTQFDGVLVDAPCSGIGTWHRNPQARWTTSSEDVEELGEIQERILGNVVPGLKPGGRLIYAVCTLTKRETIDVVAAMARGFPEIQPMPAANPLRGPAPSAAQHCLWPQVKYGNGMFVAIWRKGQIQSRSP